MENVCGGGVKEDDQMDLPPGFRFHPTDEELITHYLYKKVFDVSFSCKAIGDVDLNKNEPWELPWKAKMGEKEWYFFCMRDRKYPTGLRTNRATVTGYWKATGKDKEIYRGKSLVGMKKTLVFYKGRAPKGEKTNWVMHEYRLDGKFSVHNLPKTAKNEWVICRVFQKSCGGKKTHISGLMRLGSYGNTELGPSGLPPLMDSSPDNDNNNGIIKSVAADSAYVPCFSNSIETNTTIENCFSNINNPLMPVPSNRPDFFFPRVSTQFYSPVSSSPSLMQFQQSSVFMQDQSILRALIGNQGSNLSQSFKTEREMISVSQDTCLTADHNMNNNNNNPEISSVISTLDAPPASSAPLDLDCLWNY